MKKKIVYILLFLLLFLGFFNYRFFLGNYYNFIGNTFYDDGKYSHSLTYHKKASNYIKSSKVFYNIGNDYYKMGDYENSLEYYKNIFDNDLDEFSKLYNLGNIFYRLGEKYVDNSLESWAKSVEYYDKALSIKEDKEARMNYEYVLKKINSFKKEKELEKNKNDIQNKQKEKKDEEDEEVKKSDENQGNTKENSEKDSQNNENQEDKKDNQKSGSGANSQSLEQKEEKDETKENKIGSNLEISELTDKEKEELLNYEKFLRAVEKNNQTSFNKKRQDSNQSFDDFFDFYFNNGGEKDW
ncbi:hypothetical protein CSA08_01360 [Candidatus Gracilibacteria bacterium]|nr:MAG: hypothetical protein CSA08_01360 [Candidatus Gracilibacteria bacterium]